MTAAQIRHLARECGFELAGVAPALPSPDAPLYSAWVEDGMAGAMGYLTDRRAEVRLDPRRLLATARSIICVGKLYNTPQPYSTDFEAADLAWISRYAWGGDYHDVLRRDLAALAARLPRDADYKLCVDTAPLLERSYARAAGLGWIGKNTCLINEPLGSWFFLGEILTSLEIAPDSPPLDRCGTCTRCIEACPTGAIASAGYELDARLCISYLTIELHGAVPDPLRASVGANVFGCDICQDVCPWNRRAPVTDELEFADRHGAIALERMGTLSELEFREMFRGTPVSRARYAGFLRNVAIAMGNSGMVKFQAPLERMAAAADEIVREHAQWALKRLGL